MDVAKYIGLFLMKNKFVYIHGLGNLELRRKPGTYDGENLKGASYEVTITTLGSIDDNLANFIATNEQISISKASNALREFSQQAKTDLNAGKSVVIPGVGAFVEERGKTGFVTDPAFRFTPPAIPTVRVALRQKENIFATKTEAPELKPSYTELLDEPSGEEVNWGKVALWGAVVVALAVAAYFGIQYLGDQKNTTEAPLVITPVETPEAAPAPVADTTSASDSVSNMANDNVLLSFNVILNSYTDRAKAQRRLERLISYGNKVELAATPDSTTLHIILPVANVAPADTAKLLDSLKSTFNPSGVSIMQ